MSRTGPGPAHGAHLVIQEVKTVGASYSSGFRRSKEALACSLGRPQVDGWLVDWKSCPTSWLVDRKSPAASWLVDRKSHDTSWLVYRKSCIAWWLVDRKSHDASWLVDSSLPLST